VIGWMLDQALQWIRGSVRDTLNQVWNLLATTLFQLPNVTALPQVQALSARALLVVNTTYVLAVIAAALAVMMNGSLQIRYGLRDLIPRLVLGLGAANLATAISAHLIETTNTLVMALTGQGIASTHTLHRLLQLITQQLDNPVAALLTTVNALILLVLVVLLMTGWITRFIALILLCSIAPLALACHGTPWSDGIARLWWQAMAGIGLSVLLQAVALNAGLSIFLSPAANLSGYGLPPDPSGLLDLLIVAVLLGATVRIPALVRRHLAQGGNRQNIVGALVRLVVAQHVTRAVTGALRPRSTATGGLRGGFGPRAGTGSGRASGGPLSAVAAGRAPLRPGRTRPGPRWPARPRSSTSPGARGAYPSGTGWPAGPPVLPQRHHAQPGNPLAARRAQPPLPPAGRPPAGAPPSPAPRTNPPARIRPSAPGTARSVAPARGTRPQTPPVPPPTRRNP
jgi:hypothetical protein